MRVMCKDHPVLDPYGHHLVSGCFIDGHGRNTHFLGCVKLIVFCIIVVLLSEKKRKISLWILCHILSDDMLRGVRTDISGLNYNGFWNKFCINEI